MSQETNDIYRKHESFFRQVSENMVKTDFVPIKKVYIDLMCLKDLRLGLLLSLSTKDRIEYLKANLNLYNCRPIRNFLFAFPEFHYTEDQLQKMILTEAYQQQAFKYAPDTDLLVNLPELGNAFAQTNIRAEYPDKIRVYINTFPMKVDAVLKGYADFLNVALDNTPLTFEVFSHDPTKIDSGTWCSFNYQFIDNIIPLARDTSCPWARACFVDASLQQNHVFAAHNIEPQILEKYEEQVDWENDEHVKLIFSATEATLDLLTNFKFTRFRIPIDAPEQNTKDTIITH